MERNDFSNFGRGSPKEHFYEIILKSGQLAYEDMLFTGFFYFCSGGHFVQRSGTILAILVKGSP